MLLGRLITEEPGFVEWAETAYRAAQEAALQRLSSRELRRARKAAETDGGRTHLKRRYRYVCRIKPYLLYRRDADFRISHPSPRLRLGRRRRHSGDDARTGGEAARGGWKPHNILLLVAALIKFAGHLGWLFPSWKAALVPVVAIPLLLSIAVYLKARSRLGWT